jgi:hypothetical protein
MSWVIQQLAEFLQSGYWRRGCTGPDKKKVKIAPSELTFVLAEDVIVLPISMYISYVTIALRSLLVFIVTAFSLLFIALHVYTFRADQAIDAGFLMLFVLLAVTFGWVLAGMERDPLLSRLQDTNPGQLGRGFYWDLVKVRDRAAAHHHWVAGSSSLQSAAALGTAHVGSDTLRKDHKLRQRGVYWDEEYVGSVPNRLYGSANEGLAFTRVAATMSPAGIQPQIQEPVEEVIR